MRKEQKVDTREKRSDAKAASITNRATASAPTAAEYVTLVEILELTAPYEEFEAAASAAVRRLEVEGIRELVSIRFCGGPESTEIGAILTFSDRERMIRHMNMVSSWGEFKRFFGIVKPLDVRVYGRLSGDAETWIGQFGDIVSRKFEDHTGGFVR